MSTSRDQQKPTLEIIGKCGEGQFGDVYYCKYHGNDPEIQKFANNGIVLVKIPKNATAALDTHETEIATHLANPTLGVTACPRSTTLLYEGKKTTVSEVISYGTDPATNMPLCLNLEDFLKAQRNSIDPNQPKIFNVDLDKALNTIFRSIASSQNQLHRAGVLHLDSGCRNFMVGSNLELKIIDFGLSEILPATPGKNYGIFPLRDPNKSPILIMDQQGVGHKQTVTTDFYARRMAMIEAMSIVLGGSLPNTVKLQFSDLTQQEKAVLESGYNTPGGLVRPSPSATTLSTNEYTWVKSRSETKDDRFMLEHCVNFLYTKAKNRNDELGNQMCAVIDAYRNYLIYPPKQKENSFTPWAIKFMGELDQKKLNTAEQNLVAIKPSQSVAASNVAPSATSNSSTTQDSYEGYSKAPSPVIPPPPPRPKDPSKSASTSTIFSALSHAAPKNDSAVASSPSNNIEEKLAKDHLALISKLLDIECIKQSGVAVVVSMRKMLGSNDNTTNKVAEIINLANEEMKHSVNFRSKDPRDAFAFRDLVKSIANGDPDKLQARLTSIESAQKVQRDDKTLERNDSPSKRLQ